MMYNCSAASDGTQSYSDQVHGVVVTHLRPWLHAKHQTQSLHFNSNSTTLSINVSQIALKPVANCNVASASVCVRYVWFYGALQIW